MRSVLLVRELCGAGPDTHLAGPAVAACQGTPHTLAQTHAAGRPCLPNVAATRQQEALLSLMQQNCVASWQEQPPEVRLPLHRVSASRDADVARVGAGLAWSACSGV